MKHIYLLRHAKSSWKDLRLTDHERPLNPRGRRDAPRMASHIKKLNIEISEIYSSTSRRTRETIVPFIETQGLESSNVHYEQDLYHGSPPDYEYIIQNLGQNKDHVMLVGHNPGITTIADQCSKRYIDNVPTGGFLILQADINDWQLFSFYNCNLVNMIIPKAL